MMPGPTIIKKCSGCSNLISQYTIISGNTLGATFWTDGKMEAPMLPDQPWLVICPHCKMPLWIDELEEIGEVDFGYRSGQYENALHYIFPTFDEYFSLLEKETLTPEKEFYLRLRLWRSGNDERRSVSKKTAMSSREISNVQILADMLKEENENNTVMKAEMMRELGRFDECIILLERPFSVDLSGAVTKIKDLAKKKDQFVRKLH